MENFANSEQDLYDHLRKLKKIFTFLSEIQKSEHFTPDLQELITLPLEEFIQKFQKNPSQYPNVLNHLKNQREAQI